MNLTNAKEIKINNKTVQQIRIDGEVVYDNIQLLLSSTSAYVKYGGTVILNLVSEKLPNKNIKLYEVVNMTKTLLDTLTTDENGEASYTYTGTGAGEVDFVAEYDERESNVVTVDDYTPAPDSVSLIADSYSVNYGTSVTLTATVKDQHNQAISGQTVTFKNGSTTLGTGTTNGSGVATLTKSDLDAGTYSITAEISTVSSTPISISVQKINTNLTISVPQLVYSDTFSITGVLKDTNNNLIAGATVKLYWKINDLEQMTSGTTDNNGEVTFSRDAPTTITNYEFWLAYETSTNYNASTSSHETRTVGKETSVLTLSSPINGSSFTGDLSFAGVLEDNDGTPLAGKTLQITVNGVNSSENRVTTGDDGSFTKTVSSLLVEGTNTVKITFIGDDYYTAVTSGDITVTKVSFDGISLSSDKSILSYADNESATLTAQLTYNDVPVSVSGETVTFEVRKQSDDSLIETLSANTDSSGVATVSYLGKHAKSIYIKAISGNFYDIVQIEDIYFYREQEYSYTKTSSNINSLIDPNLSLTLPTNCEITFDCKCTGGTSSNEHRFFLLPKSEFSNGAQPAHGVYWQNTGGSNGSWGTRNNSSNQVGTFNFPTNTYISVKLVKQGNNIVFYVDNSSKGSVNMPINMSNYTNWTFSIHLWNDGTGYLKNLKIEEL